MVTLTVEQREEIQKAGDVPIRIEDPETHATYVLLRAEVYQGLRAVCTRVGGREYDRPGDPRE